MITPKNNLPHPIIKVYNLNIDELPDDTVCILPLFNDLDSLNNIFLQTIYDINYIGVGANVTLDILLTDSPSDNIDDRQKMCVDYVCFSSVQGCLSFMNDVYLETLFHEYKLDVNSFINVYTPPVALTPEETDRAWFSHMYMLFFVVYMGEIVPVSLPYSFFFSIEEVNLKMEKHHSDGYKYPEEYWLHMYLLLRLLKNPDVDHVRLKFIDESSEKFGTLTLFSDYFAIKKEPHILEENDYVYSVGQFLFKDNDSIWIPDSEDSANGFHHIDTALSYALSTYKLYDVVSAMVYVSSDLSSYIFVK